MEKIFNRLTIAVFVLIIFGANIGTFIWGGRETVSFFENRTLAKLTELTPEAYMNGEFVSSAENAFSDNIIFRDGIIKAHTLLNRYVLMKNQINDVVFGDDVLLAYYQSDDFDKDTTDREIDEAVDNLVKISKFTEENGGKFIFAGIPAQFSIMRDKYPRFYCDYSPKLDYVENRLFSALDEKGVVNIDMKKIFLGEENYQDMYFKTDHHYNFYGALFTYQTIMNKINEVTGRKLEVLKLDDMNLSTLPNKFLGSSSRKIYDIFPNDDELVIGSAKKGAAFKRYESGNEVQATVFKPQNSKYCDYSVFMGGDNPESLIDTNRDELPSILIFGDSYTNPLETIIYNNFNKTYILDFRYYKEKTLAEYIQEVKPDIVLYVRDETIYTSKEDNGDFFGELSR